MSLSDTFKLRICFFLFLFTAKFASAIPFISTARESFEQIETHQNFVRALSDAFALISNPDTSEIIKTEQIDTLFEMVDTFCQSQCEIPLKTLEKFNELAESKPIRILLENLKGTRFEKQVKQAEQVRKNILVARNALAGQKPEVIRYRLRATVELARYIISLREKAYFQALSSQDKRIQNTRSVIQADIIQLTKYMRSMQEIGLVLGDFFQRISQAGKTIKSTTEGMKLSGLQDQVEIEAKIKESLVFTEFTESEAKRIAEAVSGLNLIVFNKAVQSLSNNSLLLGVGSRRFFKKFQDHLPQTPAEQILKIIREDLGREPSDVFIDFDPEKPIASATIGQTYRAKIRTWWGGTREVIVKVQKPGLAEDLETSRKVDILLMKTLKVFQGAESRESIFGLIGAQLTGFEDAIAHEMNFENEFDHLERARNLLILQTGVRVPKPIRRLSSRRVLVMELLPGQNIDTLITNAEEGAQIEKTKMYERLFKAFLYQVLVLGELHGDMHPGNILATENGDLGIIDWAHVFKSRGMVSYPAKCMYYAMTGQPEKFFETFMKMNQAETFPTDEFKSMVMANFERAKIKPKTLSQLFFDQSGNQADLTLSVFEQTIKDAMKLGFKVTPAYLQFLRTSLPVFSTLNAISRDIPQDEKFKIMKKSLIWVYPSGIFQLMIGKGWHTLTIPQRALAKRISNYVREIELTRAAENRSLVCQRLFMTH